ncbi:MAG TPA: response regulator [Polyangiaceae bacterium]|nr:response regulator [Polyangiaceae bacterium]
MRFVEPGPGVSGIAARRALVVDDSKVMRTILRRTLEGRGFEVIEAENGRRALERLTMMRIPELALVDWNMPEMNGIELICELRRDPNYDAMLVMMVTTETETEQVQRALNAGANEYVMKPFSEDILSDKLSMLGFEAP